MVRVIYKGDVSPMNIKIPTGRIQGWKTGEIKDLQERSANKLVGDNKNFTFVNGKKAKKLEEKQVEEVKEDVKFDLNNDGKVDKTDLSIAAKVLYHGSRQIKNEQK